MHFARDSNAIEEHTRNRYLELSMSSQPSKVGRTQALVAGYKNQRRKARPKGRSTNADSTNKILCYRCSRPGHKWQECKARVIVTPSQAGDTEKGSDSTGESFEFKVFAAAVERNGSQIRVPLFISLPH